jgi:hypothetical protein
MANLMEKIQSFYFFPQSSNNFFLLKKWWTSRETFLVNVTISLSYAKLDDRGKRNGKAELLNLVLKWREIMCCGNGGGAGKHF